MIARPWNELLAAGNPQDAPIATSRLLIVLVSLPAAILVVAVLLNGQRGISAVAALIALGALVWAMRRVWLAPFSLISALILEETCPYLNIVTTFASILPFNPTSRWWIRYPLLLGLCLPAIPAVLKSGLLKQGYYLGFLLYFGWAAISISFSKYPAVSAGRLFPAVLLFCALCLIASKVHSADDVQIVLGRYLLGCGVLLGLTLIAALAFPAHLSMQEAWSAANGPFSWVESESGITRFSGLFVEPNQVGSLMLSTTCAGLAHWHATSGGRRGLLALAIFASVIFGLMADSRSAFVALAAGAALYAIWKYRLPGLTACLGVAFLVIGLYSLMGAEHRNYLNRDLGTFTGRTTVWRFEMRKLAESPLIGYGFDIEGGLFEDRYFPDWTEFFEGGPLVELHSGYFTVAIGMGFPALIFLLFVLLGPWISLLRRQDDKWHLKPVFFFVIIPALVRASVESGIGEPRYTEGLLLFLCWALAERYRILEVKAELPHADSVRLLGCRDERLR